MLPRFGQIPCSLWREGNPRMQCDISYYLLAQKRTAVVRYIRNVLYHFIVFSTDFLYVVKEILRFSSAEIWQQFLSITATGSGPPTLFQQIYLPHKPGSMQ